MDVEFIDGPDGEPTRAYAICERRDDIGRIEVPLERLQRWNTDLQALANLIKSELKSPGEVGEIVFDRLWRLGRVTFRAGRVDVFLARGVRWQDAAEQILSNPRIQECSRYLLLTVHDSLDSIPPGKVAISLARLLDFSNGGIILDRDAIEDELARRLGRTSYHGSKFPTPTGTRWEQVSIRILAGDDGAQISAGDVTEPVTPAQMGLVNPRNAAKPTKLWELLVLLSRKHRIDFENCTASRAIPKRIERLSAKLRTYFGIEDNPFKPYHEAKGYEPRFEIRHV